MKFTTLGTSHGDPTPTRFNTSTLLESGRAAYLFDAGAPVNALLIRRGVPFAKLRHLFVTHMHEDHVGGIPGLVKSFVKYPVPGQKLAIHLPEREAIGAVLGFLRATHREWPEGMVVFDAIAPGMVWEDENVRVRAFPTRHMENERLAFPSFGFVIESGGRRVVYTGDLKFDFSDFPRNEFESEADCICECTHFPLERAMEVLAGLPIRSLICTHVADCWHGKKGEAEFRRLTATLPFPVSLAHDGDEFVFQEQSC